MAGQRAHCVMARGRGLSKCRRGGAGLMLAWLMLVLGNLSHVFAGQHGEYPLHTAMSEVPTDPADYQSASSA